MKSNVTITSRCVNTLPVEMYTSKRMREFDAAEQELTTYLAAKAPAVKRTKQLKRKHERQGNHV